jgi:hypothetical protein
MNLKTPPKKNLPRLVQDAAVQKHRSWFFFWHKTWRENSFFHHSLLLRVHTFNIMSKIGHRSIWGHTFMLSSAPPPKYRSRPNNKKPYSSRYKKSKKKEEKKIFWNAFHGREQLCFTIATSPRRASICIAATACAIAKGWRQPDDERRQTTNGLIRSSNTALAFVLWMN